ncbi:MAG: orotate phosphoribosyltransferase [Calditrichia bacterium]
MDKKEALRIFEETGALQNGHFLLTSGLHSPQYFQCALVLQYPQYLEKFCREIVEFFFEEENIDVVIAPAIGGIVVAQELARQLNTRAIFAERENGRMTLRRGFVIEEKENVLVCEDVITTGGSVREILQLVEDAGAYPVGVGTIINRGEDLEGFDVPVFAPVEVRAITYSPEKCPLCQQNIPLVKPGSRQTT